MVGKRLIHFVFTIILLAVTLTTVACSGATPTAQPQATATEVTAETEPTAAATAAEPTGELPVGLLLPFTGQYDWVGSNVLPVVQMVADEVNASGGINGAEITLVQGDTEGVVEAGTTAAQKLVNIDGVLALIGPTSLSFTGVKQIIQDNGVPIVTPTAGTTELDSAGTTYFFRTVPSDSLGGRAIARAVTDAQFLEQDDAFATISLMVGQAPALISFRDPIAESLQNYGTEATAVVEYQTDKQSYRSEVQEAMAPDPDVIILVGTPEDSVRIMQAAFEAGYEGSWFVTQDQTNEEFITLAGTGLVEGIYGLEEVPAEESAQRTEAFRQRFMDYAGEEIQIFGTNAYDAANVLFLAMLRASLQDGDVTRQTITSNIRQVANPGEDKQIVTDFSQGRMALEDGQEINYQGLVGPIDFDDFGNIAAPFGIRRVKDGTWTTVATVEAGDLQP